MKDKYGKQVTTKEFFQRWREGISLVTPIQRLTNEARSNMIMFIGYAVGFVALIIYRDRLIALWFAIALMIIFFGAGMSVLIKWFGIRQQLKIFKDLDENAEEFI